MKTTYKIVFEGKLEDGRPDEEVKENLAKLLQQSPETIAQLFLDTPKVLKTGLDSITAKKYENAIKEAGGRCRVVPMQEQKAPVKRGGMVLTNIESVPGTTIVEHFGLVSGSTIRAKHVGKDFMASLKNIVGGELKGYTQLLQESRDEAVARMKAQAEQLGANAIINIRFSTSSVTQGAAELYAYGTAVRVE